MATKSTDKIVSLDSGPSASERKWKAEDAHRDIMRAEAHRADKGLMKDVAKLHAEKLNEMKNVKLCK